MSKTLADGVVSGVGVNIGGVDIGVGFCPKLVTDNVHASSAQNIPAQAEPLKTVKFEELKPLVKLPPRCVHYLRDLAFSA